MTRKLRKGVHWVHMTGQSGKRKVRVDSKGRWHFMKGHKGGKRIPLAIVVPALLPAVTPLQTLMAGGAGSIQSAALQLRYGYTGVDGTGVFRAGKLMELAVPVIVGIAVHKVAGKRINKYLPKPLGI